VTVASKTRTLAASDPLAFRRLRLEGSVSASASAPDKLEPDSRTRLLGGRWVGHASSAVQAPLLLPSDSAVFDGWFGTTRLEQREHRSARYVTDGLWLHGVVEIDDRVDGMQVAAHRAYADLFEVLATNDCPNLLRLWNYLSDINGEVNGVERYRQFNAGRQQAFIEARRSAFEGSPAACALGTQGGPLLVYFLAGRKPPLAIENPRQTSAYRYPETYGPRSPTFSRAALADVGGGRNALFISGTASIVGHATLHVGDVRRQTEESLANIAVVRDAANHAAATRAAHPFAADELTYTVYVRRAEDLGAVREVFERIIGSHSVAVRDAIYLQADICRADLLVEIEAHGFAPSGSPA
jgi:chorismate lyase/3-hydroxybenzoate synthase